MQVGVVVAVASIATGLANLGLLAYLRQRGGRPGLTWFQGVIACQTVFCSSYGVGLLLGRSPLRVPLLMAYWLAAIWIGVCYLAFALDYTGRGDYVHSAPFRVVLGVQAVASALVLTFPLHDVGPTALEYVSIGGASVLNYAASPFVVFEFVVVAALAGLGVSLLLDTVVSYGRLYRKHAVAIAVTPLFPIVAWVLWLLEVGPIHPLNLTPVAFFPHLVLDLYALYGEDMFEFPPATRRTAERAALDDLGNPVVVVDTEGRIVRMNPAAVGAFDRDQADALTANLDVLLEPVEEEASEVDLVRVDGSGDGRVYARTRNELVDGTGTVVGYTHVLQDVTEERRREQRLGVLNRVLRHNLRNDLTVVLGNVDAAASATDDEHVRELLEVARDQTEELAALGERARDVDAVMSGSATDDPTVDAARELRAIVVEARERHPDATVDVDVPASVQLPLDGDVFRVVFENLVENALAHGGPDPTVSVRLDGAPRANGSGPTDASAGERTTREEATVVVADRGPGIPDHELAVLDSGEESSLEHGSGLGLWVVNWGVTAMGGDLAFVERDGGGTAVRVTLPAG